MFFNILLYNFKILDKEYNLNIKKLILIGASTGGPGHMQKIIKSLDLHFDGTIIIAQHMQSPYIESFAKQLNNNTFLDVLQTKDNLILKNEKIYILPENYEVKNKFDNLYFSKSDKKLNYSPNIDLLFSSILNITKKLKIMCVILTGIGNDGAIGALNLSKKDATCINENEKSAIVYGMPKAASELNPSAKQLCIDDICKEINEF